MATKKTRKLSPAEQIIQQADKSWAKFCLVRQASTGKWYRYNQNSPITIMESDIQEIYSDWEEYCDKHLEDDLRMRFKEVFNVHPPKAAVKEEIALTIYITMAINSEDRTNIKAKKEKGGKRGPRKSLQDRVYIYRLDDLSDEETKKYFDPLPPQAVICAKIVARECENDECCVKESRLREAMTEAHDTGELITGQDPWRIFSYYRARLVESGIIKHD